MYTTVTLLSNLSRSFTDECFGTLLTKHYFRNPLTKQGLFESGNIIHIIFICSRADGIVFPIISLRELYVTMETNWTNGAPDFIYVTEEKNERTYEWANLQTRKRKLHTCRHKCWGIMITQLYVLSVGSFAFVLVGKGFSVRICLLTLKNHLRSPHVHYVQS